MNWASQGRSQGVNEMPVLLPTGFYEVASWCCGSCAVSSLEVGFFIFLYTGESQCFPLPG